MEEFGPKIYYIKGEANIVADTLSRLEMIPAKTAEDQKGIGRNQQSTKSETLMFSLFQTQTRSMTSKRNKAPTDETTSQAAPGKSLGKLVVRPFLISRQTRPHSTQARARLAMKTFLSINGRTLP